MCISASSSAHLHLFNNLSVSHSVSHSLVQDETLSVNSDPGQGQRLGHPTYTKPRPESRARWHSIVHVKCLYCMLCRLPEAVMFEYTLMNWMDDY